MATSTRSVRAPLTKSSAASIERALEDLADLIADGWTLDRLELTHDASGVPVLRIVVS